MDEDLEFLIRMVPVLVPVVGALATVVVARLGIGGQLRHLELLRARLELTSELLQRDEADEALRDRLRLQINDIVGEMITEYGSVGDADIDPAILTRHADLPTPWEDLPWWRRWVLLPMPRSIWGRVLSVMSYYWLLIFVLSSLVLTASGFDEATTTEFLPGWIALIGIMLLTRHGVRWLYGRARQGRVDQIFARAHRAHSGPPGQGGSSP